MTLDQYSLCPCGSGKKIKFCKCAENLTEMVKVDRMIEGEQFVAALDRINVLLKTFPTDAWLLALKCNVLLRLNEYDSLEEASAKFIRLRPDNPLAKIYRSFVAVIRGNLEESAGLLLQALADSGDGLHPLYFSAAGSMIGGMVRMRMNLTALMHSEILSELTEQPVDFVVQMYESIVSDADVSILLREDPPSGQSLTESDWTERFREASALISRFQVAQARTKLESILREFGPMPTVLIALLNCKIMLGDQIGAAQTCQKLADHEGLTDAQRVYFQALAFELNPDSYGLMLKDDLTQYSIEDESSLETQLNAHPNLFAIRSDEYRQMIGKMLQEEVPPKVIYHLLRPLNDDAEKKPSVVNGWLAVLGKQTDRPARVVMVEPQLAVRGEVAQKIREDLGLTSLNRTVVASPESMFYDVLPKTVALAASPTAEESASYELLMLDYTKKLFLGLEFGALDKQTCQQAASNPRYAVKIKALLLQWLASGQPQVDTGVIRELHETLGLQMPVVASTEDTFDLVSGASYFWTDLTTIDNVSLIQLMQSALTRNVRGAYQSLIEKHKQVEWSDDLKNAADYTALNMQLRLIKSPDEAVDLLEQIYETGKRLKMVVGQAVLERFELLCRMGRTQEAQLFLQKAISECPQDPVINEFLNAALYQMQRSQAGGGPAAAGDNLSSALLRHRVGQQAPAEERSSGLWTPDSPQPAASAGNESGSKLWLPGQD